MTKLESLVRIKKVKIVAVAAIFFCVFSVLFGCRQDTPEEQSANSILLESKLDSLILDLENYNENTAKDSISEMKSNDILDFLIEIKAWGKGRDVMYLFMVNGDWESDDFYNKMERLSKENILPDSLSNLALYYSAYLDLQLGNIDKSKELHEKYISYCIGRNDEGCSIGAYDNLGNIAIRKGDYELARKYYNHSYLSIKEEGDSIQLLDYHYRVGQTYFYSENYKMALSSFNNALNYEGEKDVELRLEIARCLVYLKQLKESNTYLDDIDVSKVDTSLQIFYFQIKGKDALARNRKTEAIKYYSKTAKLAKAYYHKTHRELGKIISEFAIVLLDCGNLNAAMEICHSAMKIFVPTVEFKNDVIDINSLEFSTEIWIPEILGLESHILFRMSLEDGEDEKRELAMSLVENALSRFNFINSHYSYDNSRYHLSNYILPLFNHWINMIEVSSFSDSAKKEKIFQIIQKSQAFSLKQSIREKVALEMSGLTTNQATQLDDIEERISFYQGLINKENNLDQNRILKDSLFKFVEKEKMLKVNLAMHYPQYNKYKNVDRSLSLLDAQNALDNNELLVQFFCTEKELKILAIRKDTSIFITKAVSDTLFWKIEQYNNYISDLELVRQNNDQIEAEFIQSSKYLYEVLLNEIIQKLADPNTIDKLIISTSGPISSLAMDALIIRDTDSWMDKKSFLIYEYAISYNILMSDLKNSEKDKVDGKSNILAVGINYDPEMRKRLNVLMSDSTLLNQNTTRLKNKYLSVLPFATVEAEAVVEQIGGTVLLNKSATKSNFKKLAKDYKLLHISSHAYIDHNYPLRSCFVLSPENDEASSAFFHLREIGQLELKCEQIVLSACETAVGPVLGGEGIISIARYFQMAGCNSVVASQWSVPDEPTYQIMNVYYKNLLKGEDKDIALQKAKLEYVSNDEISSPSKRSPLFWASFCLYGNRDAIK